MSDYPDFDEEFELNYGDELELLNTQNDFDEPVFSLPSNKGKSRKSLDFESSNINKKSTSSSQAAVNLEPDSTAEVISKDDIDIHPAGHSDMMNDERLSQDHVELPYYLDESGNSVSNSTATSTNVGNEEPPRKRTIEELFGDIDDLLFENERKTKKKKSSTKYEEQLEMIDKILEMRRMIKENSNNALFPAKASVLSSRERNKLNISWRVPNYPFIKITRHDNEKVYVRCHSETYEKEDIVRVVESINTIGVVSDMFKDTWKQAQKIINDELDAASKNTEEMAMDVDVLEDDNLWTDLYRPKRYLELLSDELTNRILLKWLKLWDKVVFNRRPKVRVKPQTQFKPFNFLESQLKLDEDGRPSFKVALLCGNPGLGKTTLAHVVAKHAGYNVIEINASDDRSLESFRTSVENATQMTSVIDQEKRPNCIIFDEIDGAPGPSIDFLVKFITGNESRSKGKKKEKNKHNMLKRPIICVCNDGYVPALRNLRQIAFVVNFPPTSSNRLAERLMQISRKQQLKTDMGAMIALAEKSNNDIRTCLSVLHFFKFQNKPVTLSDVYRSSVGQKDMQKGLFSVWQDIFHIERAKNKQLISAVISEEDKINEYDMSNKARMQKILKVVQSFGDYERVAQGVFENYPDMPIKDSSLSGTILALDWFCYSDKLNQFVMTQQNYSLSSYLPYAFVVWHFQFSSLVWPKIKYPSQAFEVRQRRANSLAIVREIEKGVQAKLKNYLNTKNLVLDILPTLTRILTPPLRPVNLHLFTQEEKKTFAKIVEIMLDYNLNYIQQKREDGIYEFKLDPDIFSLVTFSISAQNRRTLSYFNKQLISREVELGKIRRVQAANVSQDGKQKDQKQKSSKKATTSSALKSPDQDHLPNHLRKLKVKTVKTAETMVRKDFFGRVLTDSQIKHADSKKSLLDSGIWFKYKEGYSNAVRKKIKMKDL